MTASWYGAEETTKAWSADMAGIYFRGLFSFAIAARCHPCGKGTLVGA